MTDFRREYLGSWHDPGNAHTVGEPEAQGIEIIIHDPPMNSLTVSELSARLGALDPSLVRVDMVGLGGPLSADLRNRGFKVRALAKRPARGAGAGLEEALAAHPLLSAMATKIEGFSRDGAGLTRITFDGPALPEKQVCEFSTYANAADGFWSALHECEVKVAAAMKKSGLGV